MDFENECAALENAMPADDAVIKICNLTKRYGSKKAVSNASFCVKRGEIMGFLGPNGAGKSTTMNILTGYISASEGSAELCGIDILENPKAAKAKIGYLPENPPLYFDMTVWEYLEFVCELKKVKTDYKEHIKSVMETVKITAVADRIIKNLSKGYKQRVGLAQALIGDPEVLVLDEPTVGLDPKQIIEIRNVIKELGKSRTVILSTHILQEVSAICDRVTIINRGKIVATDTLKNLSEQLGEKGKYMVSAFGTQDRVLSILKSVEGISEITQISKANSDEQTFIVEFSDGFDLRREVFEAFAKADVPMSGLKSMELTLEEIFLKLTSKTEPEDEEETKPAGTFFGGLGKLFARKEKQNAEKTADINETLKDSAKEAENAEKTEETENAGIAEETENSVKDGEAETDESNI